MKDIFVTGTDTGVGKTVTAAALAAALGAAYWKPIQTGRADGAETDREAVRRWAGLDEANAPPEAYVFDPPVSPHLAAREAGTPIDLDRIRKPATPAGRLVIEGAGGVLAPVNDRLLMLDLIARLDARVVVTARTSLGTINHTLLTLRALRAAGFGEIGVVLNGEEHRDNRTAIQHYGEAPVVGWIPRLDPIDRKTLLYVYGRYFDREFFK